LSRGIGELGIGVGIAIKKLNLFALFNDIGSVYLGL
jgi:hypothetical protein